MEPARASLANEGSWRKKRKPGQGEASVDLDRFEPCIKMHLSSLSCILMLLMKVKVRNSKSLEMSTNWTCTLSRRDRARACSELVMQ